MRFSITLLQCLTLHYDLTQFWHQRIRDHQFLKFRGRVPYFSHSDDFSVYIGFGGRLGLGWHCERWWSHWAETSWNFAKHNHLAEIPMRFPQKENGECCREIRAKLVLYASNSECRGCIPFDRVLTRNNNPKRIRSYPNDLASLRLVSISLELW